MEPPGTVLANIDHFDRIYRCGDCDNIHMQVDPATILLSIKAYM